MYINKDISQDAHELHMFFNQKFSTTRMMTTAAILPCMAAALQSLGDLLPGAGYILSMFSAFPIFIISLYSLFYGAAGYAVTMLLLLIIMPSELMLFPFTTGLLGLGLAAGIRKIKKRALVILFNSILLLAGISILLYIFKFPVLGPAAGSGFDIRTFALIFGFTVIYSTLCTEFSLWLTKRLKRLLKKTASDSPVPFIQENGDFKNNN